MRLFVSGTRPELLEPGAYQYLGAQTSPRTSTSEAFLRATGLHVACDNDCFGRFDPAAYRRLLERIRQRPGDYLFVTAPDIVGDARTTLGLWEWWGQELTTAGAGMDEPLPAAFVGQDGAEDLDLDHHVWGYASAFFVGGSTAWKPRSAQRR